MRERLAQWPILSWAELMVKTRSGGDFGRKRNAKFDLGFVKYEKMDCVSFFGGGIFLLEPQRIFTSKIAGKDSLN